MIEKCYKSHPVKMELRGRSFVKILAILTNYKFNLKVLQENVSRFKIKKASAQLEFI